MEEVLKVSITCIMCCMNNVFLCSFPPFQSLMQKSRGFTCVRRQSPLATDGHIYERQQAGRKGQQMHRCAHTTVFTQSYPTYSICEHAGLDTHTQPHTHKPNHFCLMFANHPRSLTACPASYQITVFIN